MSTVATTRIQHSSHVLRGQIYWADLFLTAGCEQGNGNGANVRPVLVIQNNTGNKYAPTVIIAIISTSATKTPLPTHVKIKAIESGLNSDSIIFLEQVKTIDQFRLMDYIGTLSYSKMQEVNTAARISIGLE